MSRSLTIRPALITVGVSVLAMVISARLFSHYREDVRRTSCQSNLKQIMLGLAQYRHDSDGLLPPIVICKKWVGFLDPSYDTFAPRAYGWADSLMPYLKSTGLYQCPSDPISPSGKADERGYVDYWMNANVVRRRNFFPTTLVLGDGNGDSTARYSIKGRPDGATGLAESAWFTRHLSGANYAFADGHVEWLRPDQVGGADAHFTP